MDLGCRRRRGDCAHWTGATGGQAPQERIGPGLRQHAEPVMSHVMRASDLVGLPVVSIASGEDIAEIRDVIYDSASHQLLGFTLNKRGFFAGRMGDSLSATAVSSIGADAVMVPTESSLADPNGEVAKPSDAVSVLGIRVMSSDGNHLGEVVGVVIETGSKPRAAGYEIASADSSDNSFVPISAQMALSDDNLLLPAEATAFIHNDLAGFGAAITDYRSSAFSEEQS